MWVVKQILQKGLTLVVIGVLVIAVWELTKDKACNALPTVIGQRLNCNNPLDEVRSVDEAARVHERAISNVARELDRQTKKQKARDERRDKIVEKAATKKGAEDTLSESDVYFFCSLYECKR